MILTSTLRKSKLLNIPKIQYSKTFSHHYQWIRFSSSHISLNRQYVTTSPSNLPTAQEQALKEGKRAFYQKNLEFFITNKEYDKAEAWFQRMKSEGLIPSLSSYKLMLWMHAKETRNITALQDMMKELRDSGLQLNSAPYHITLNALSKRNLITQIEELVDDMKGRNIEWNDVTYSILIEAYGRVGRADRSVTLYEEMKQSTTVSTQIPFMVAIDAGGWNNRISFAENVWKDMTHVYNMSPLVNTYNTMIEAYGRSGLLTKAVALTLNMIDNKVYPEPKTLVTLTGFLMKQGAMREEIQEFREMVEKKETLNLSYKHLKRMVLLLGNIQTYLTRMQVFTDHLLLQGTELGIIRNPKVIHPPEPKKLMKC